MEDYAPHLERVFQIPPSEGSYDVAPIAGPIPRYLRGVYYLNGPCLFRRDGETYRHWLDGDGMVTMLRFEDGAAHCTHRFVRSTKYLEESEAGHFVYRTFGTRFDKLKRGLGLESPVNVSAYPYDGKLLAFGEQGLPWELDPETLETRGEYNLGGRLNAITPFSAHPKFDPGTGDLYNFGIAYAAAEPVLNVYHCDAHGSLISRNRHKLAYPCSIHDFGLSPSYTIFYLSPYLLDMRELMREGKTLQDSLHWTPERGSTLFIASRETGEPVASIPIGNKYSLHLINCFEVGDKLIVDMLELDRPVYDQYQIIPDLFTDVAEGYPVRLVVNLADKKIDSRQELPYRLSPDFASVAPSLRLKPAPDFWMLGISATGKPGRKFFDQLVHGNFDRAAVDDIYQAPPNTYLGGEPMFLPDPARPTDGVVICQLIDAERQETSFALFDPYDVAAGPKSILRQQAPIAPCFHSTYRIQ
jgi:all-trans-8'-apo-beta-carotenal 15,15'-oxygenase